MAFWASKTLLSAVEMGVFTELAQGPQKFDEFSGRLGIHPRSARDFLDALVVLKLLQRNDDTYANTPETSLFLDRHKPSYVGGILEMANARLYPFWGHLTEALRTGRPQNEAREDSGDSTFTALYADPARLKSFLAAMSGQALPDQPVMIGQHPRPRVPQPRHHRGGTLDVGEQERERLRGH